MKKLFLIAALLCFAHELSAQTLTGSLTASSASCLPTNCVQWTIPQGFNPSFVSAGVQISGTFTGLTANFEASGDAGLANWSAITGSPTSAGAGVTSASATGLWQFNIAGLQGFRVRISAITSGTAVVTIQQSGGTPDDSTISVTGPVTAQIQGAGSGGQAAIVIADSSAAVAISATGSTQIVAASGTKAVYLTGWGITVGTTSATPDTVEIVYGTGSNCGTGQVVLAGPFTGGIEESLVATILPTVITYGGGLGAIAHTPASQAVCIVTTGTQAVGGILSFAQFFYVKATDGYEADLPPVWHPRRYR